MMDENDINHRVRLLASMLCQTAEQAATMLDLNPPQTAEAFAMALVSYVVGTAIKGKEAEAVRMMAGIVGNYETQIAHAALLRDTETGVPN